MSENETFGARLTTVESEVTTVRTEMAGLKSDVRSLASILRRIEEGVEAAQTRFENDKQASRLNPVALASVLITIITIMIGGAWTIGGELARHDERSTYHRRDIDRIEQRQWDSRGRGGASSVSAAPQGS